jgi:CubicO group peptidase (beta-lactamase class C family)
MTGAVHFPEIETMRSPVLTIALGSAFTWLGISVYAQSAPLARPAIEAKKAPASPAGAFSAERLKRLDRVLQTYVDDDQIAGAVALVLQDGKPVYERAVGWSDKEAHRKMTTNTLFRIASQTKAITSTAILALVEEGKIGITEPVSHFIPTSARLWLR